MSRRFFIKIVILILVIIAGTIGYLYWQTRPSADIPFGYTEVTTTSGQKLLLATYKSAILETMARKKLTFCDWPDPSYQTYDFKNQKFFGEGATNPNFPPEYDTRVSMPWLVADPPEINFEQLVFFKLPDYRSYSSLHQPWRRDRVGLTFPRQSTLLGESFIVRVTTNTGTPKRSKIASPTSGQLKILSGDNRDANGDVFEDYATIPFKAVRRSESGWGTFFFEADLAKASDTAWIDKGTAWYMVVDRSSMPVLAILDTRERGHESIIHQFRTTIDETTKQSLQKLPLVKFSLTDIPVDIDTTQKVNANLTLVDRSILDKDGNKTNLNLDSGQLQTVYFKAVSTVFQEKLTLESFSPLLCNAQSEQTVEVRYYDVEDLQQKELPKPDTLSQDILTEIKTRVTYSNEPATDVKVEWGVKNGQVIDLSPKQETTNIGSNGIAKTAVRWQAVADGTTPTITAKLTLESGDTITKEITLAEPSNLPNTDLKINIQPGSIAPVREKTDKELGDF